jgi:uncharacterized membrane protein
MRYLDTDLRRPGRLMLATGLVGFGLIGLTFNHLIDGLQPIEAGPPWTWINGVLLLLAGLGLAWPLTTRRAALAVWIVLAIGLLAHAAKVALEPRDPVAWVSMMQVAGLSAAMLLLLPGARLSSRRIAALIVGLMLICFGAVHWMYIGAIAGMIPDWMPGRTLWPWVTGGANIAAGLAIASGVLARLASALVGAMFASWILLVHLPRLFAAPDDRSEWVACALAFALTGVVWTVNGALPRNGGDFQSRPR